MSNTPLHERGPVSTGAPKTDDEDRTKPLNPDTANPTNQEDSADSEANSQDDDALFTLEFSKTAPSISGEALEIELGEDLRPFQFTLCESRSGRAPYLKVYDPEVHETYNLATETTSGQGHQALLLGAGVLLLLGIPPDTTVSILTEAGFVSRSGEPDVNEIKRDVRGRFTDGKPNDKFHATGASLVRNRKMSAERVDELMKRCYDDPNMTLDPTKAGSAKPVGQITRGDVLRCKESARRIIIPELRHHKGSPAKVLGGLYPEDASLCCVDPFNHAHPHTVAEQRALKYKGREFSHIVPSPLLDQPWLDKDGKPWIPKTERNPGQGAYLELNNHHNFPEFPSHYLIMEIDEDPDDMLNLPKAERGRANYAWQKLAIFYVADLIGMQPKMIVRSGRAPFSLHVWWDVQGWTDKHKLDLIKIHVAVGFDSCGGQPFRKFRMPNGVRVHDDNTTSIQEVLYYV